MVAPCASACSLSRFIQTHERRLCDLGQGGSEGVLIWLNSVDMIVDSVRVRAWEGYRLGGYVTWNSHVQVVLLALLDMLRVDA